MANISTWSTTAANNNATPPDGFPEGQTPGSVNNSARELMAALRRQHEDAQWIDLGLTHTRTGGSTFTISGDYTSTYDVGRRVKMTGSATAYGTISASSYSAPNTTVTISEGNIPATLASVSLGILSAANGALPVLSGSFTGTLTPGTGSAGTGTIKYLVLGGICTLYVDSAFWLDSSTRYGTMVLSGIPTACRPSSQRVIRCAGLSSPDGAGPVARTLGAIVVGTGGTAQLYLDDGLGALTATFPDDSLGSANGFAAGWSVSYPLV